jgi:hypothetical protein
MKEYDITVLLILLNVSRQFPAAMNTQTIAEKLLHAVFSVQSV